MRRRLSRLGNFFVILLLRSPLHGLASGSLLVLSYRGRRSGRRLTVPVMYAQTAGDLVVFVGHPERKSWWRNLRGGAQVEVRLRGGRLCGNAIVTDGEAAGSYRALPAGASSRRCRVAADLRSDLVP